MSKINRLAFVAALTELEGKAKTREAKKAARQARWQAERAFWTAIAESKAAELVEGPTQQEQAA